MQADLHGLTGHIEFNEGKRTNFKLDLLKLKREELVKVGEWKLDSGINISDVSGFYETGATNITLIVMTREVNFITTFSVYFLNWITITEVNFFWREAFSTLYYTDTFMVLQYYNNVLQKRLRFLQI